MIYYFARTHLHLAFLVFITTFLPLSCASELGVDKEAPFKSLADDSNNQLEQFNFVNVYGGGSPEIHKLLQYQVRGPYACDFHEGSATSTTPNAFLHYRGLIHFVHESNSSYDKTVPLFFNGTINPAEKESPTDVEGAECGFVWEARFRLEGRGTYTYQVEFEKGQNLGIEPPGQGSGTKIYPDGIAGSVTVQQSVANKGVVRQIGKNLYYSGTGEPFFQSGVDSPENLLAYYEFDNTEYNIGTTAPHRLLNTQLPAKDQLHIFDTHLQHYNTFGGGQLWQGGKGKNIYGAISYLHHVLEMNSIYMIIYNSEVNGGNYGDGNDTWPFVGNPSTDGYAVFDNFDVSKLQQWFHVLKHIDDLGMLIHFVYGEQEVDQHFQALNAAGDITNRRKVLLKEMLARFGALNIVHNAGEEFDVADNQTDVNILKKMADYVDALDADAIFGTHTFPSDQSMYHSLLNHPTFDAVFFQDNSSYGQNFHGRFLDYLARASCAPPYSQGCTPNDVVMIGAEAGPGHPTSPQGSGLSGAHHQLREKFVAGSLYAGAVGIEHYRGYRGYEEGDIDLEDFSIDYEFDMQTSQIRKHLETLPFDQMVNNDGRIQEGPGVAYLMETPNLSDISIYNRNAVPITVTLPAGKSWDGSFFDAETGATSGMTICVDGGGAQVLSSWPYSGGRDTILDLRERVSSCP